MVLAYSDRIPRVPPYSGYPLLPNSFVYRAFTVSGCAFQHSSTTVILGFLGPLPLSYYYFRFGLFRFRSPLLTESLFYFLFLRVLRCFSSPGSPHIPMCSVYDTITLLMVRSRIRISTDQRLFASPRSFSQLVTSFFGAMYQGILLYALCSLIFSSYFYFPWLTRLISFRESFPTLFIRINLPFSLISFLSFSLFALMYS